MTIKEYILSKPDDYKYMIDYLFVTHCPVCKKNIVEYDPEYSTLEVGTTAKFKEDIKEGVKSHYNGYDFVYDDFEVDECMLSKEDDGLEVITITRVCDEDEVCEECEEKMHEDDDFDEE